MNMQSNRFKRGVICTLLGGILWGFSGTCAQFLLSGYAIPAPYLTFIRMTCAGLLFLVFMLLRRRSVLAAILKDKKTLVSVVIFGIFGIYACQLTYIETISYTNAGTATILQSTCIAFVLIYTCFRVRRLPRGREIIGLVLAVAATFILATHGDISALSLPVLGLTWGLASGVVAAFYAIYPKTLFEQWGSFAITGLAMLFGGVASTFVAQAWTVSVNLDVPALVALVLIILLGTFAAFALFLKGVAEIGPMRATLLAAVEPVAATFFSWAFLGTQFPLVDCVGFVLMIAMVFFVATEEPAKENLAGSIDLPEELEMVHEKVL